MENAWPNFFSLSGSRSQLGATLGPAWAAIESKLLETGIRETSLGQPHPRSRPLHRLPAGRRRRRRPGHHARVQKPGHLRAHLGNGRRRPVQPVESGQWTDDTSMALCSAESLLTCDGFDPEDQLTRFVRWWRDGHWSSTGECFDIGNTVRTALERFQETGEPYPGPTDELQRGQRVAHAPCALAAVLRRRARACDRHLGPGLTDHARRLAGRGRLPLLRRPADRRAPGASEGQAPGAAVLARGGPLRGRAARSTGRRNRSPFLPEEGATSDRGDGYLVDTLEAALWAFDRTATFEEGALKVVNLGNDADTTGAVYGQIAGAFYGASAIPDGWKERLARRDEIARIAHRLQLEGPDG